MGRYGLSYPFSVFHDLSVVQMDPFIPPRFIKYRIGAPGDGTLAAAWAGTFFLSDEAEEGSSYGEIVYKVHNPAAPNDLLVGKAQIHSSAFPPPFQSNIWFTTWLEFWHNSVLMGHTPFNEPSSTSFIGIYSGFQALTNPALWGFNSNTVTQGALWADVPDYHPYRR